MSKDKMTTADDPYRIPEWPETWTEIRLPFSNNFTLMNLVFSEEIPMDRRVTTRLSDRGAIEVRAEDNILVVRQNEGRNEELEKYIDDLAWSIGIKGDEVIIS